VNIFEYDGAMVTETRPLMGEPGGPDLLIDPVDPDLAEAFRGATTVLVVRYQTRLAGDWFYVEDAAGQDYPAGFLVQGDPAHARFIFRRQDGYEGTFEVDPAGAVSHPETSTTEIVAWAIQELVAHAE